jgi:hypothetical protein
MAKKWGKDPKHFCIPRVIDIDYITMETKSVVV